MIRDGSTYRAARRNTWREEGGKWLPMANSRHEPYISKKGTNEHRWNKDKT
jgi:hypothetical protein